jgi:hypothetical protein
MAEEQEKQYLEKSKNIRSREWAASNTSLTCNLRLHAKVRN